MAAARISRGRIEAHFILMAGVRGFGKGVVDFEMEAPEAVIVLELHFALAVQDG